MCIVLTIMFRKYQKSKLLLYESAPMPASAVPCAFSPTSILGRVGLCLNERAYSLETSLQSISSKWC